MMQREAPVPLGLPRVLCFRASAFWCLGGSPNFVKTLPRHLDTFRPGGRRGVVVAACARMYTLGSRIIDSMALRSQARQLRVCMGAD